MLLIIALVRRNDPEPRKEFVRVNVAGIARQPVVRRWMDRRECGWAVRSAAGEGAELAYMR
jgi:hypothetical protein